MATASDTPENEIFLPNSEAPGQYVDFGAALKDIDGKFVLQDVNENGLAYSAGFRTGDILLTVNDISTEGKDLQFLLDHLRRDRWANLLLAVERKLGDEEMAIFKWIIFNVIVQDGTPRVHVVHSLENDTFDMPEVDFTGSVEFLGVSPEPFDIFIDSNDKQSYLKIDKNKVEFGSYDDNSSKFYLYHYSGGDPSKGNVVAYSQIRMEPSADSNNDKTCFAGKDETKVKAKDFPSSMVGSTVEPNPRLWYQHLDHDSNLHTLESYTEKDRFLGKDNNNDKAILLETETLLTIALSGTRKDEIFLPNSEAPGQHVNFGAALKDIDGKFVLQYVNENGLAYSAGFRTGDILLTANDISTEGKVLQFLLDHLRRDRWANLLLAVERKLGDEEKAIFKWIIFNVIVQDGIPRVHVVYSLENDTFDMPEVPLTSNLDFLAVSPEPFDIFIDSNDKQSYLKIDKKKVEFGSYDANSSKFYLYYYSGGDPSKGNVVAYSQIRMEPSAKCNSKTCFAGKGKKKVEAKNFPSYMVGQNIKPDPRFWYKKRNLNTALDTLESYKAKDRYLGKDKKKAILSKTKTYLTIALSGTVTMSGEDGDQAKPDACEAAGCCNGTSETGQ